jgi:HSP20 family protein
MAEHRESIDASLRELLSALIAADAPHAAVSATAVAGGLGTSLLLIVAGLPIARSDSAADRVALIEASDSLHRVQEQLLETVETETVVRLLLKNLRVRGSHKHYGSSMMHTRSEYLTTKQAYPKYLVGGFSKEVYTMFGLTRWNSFDDVFNFQREVDRLFNQFWSDLPTRTAAGASPSFQVNTTDDGWRIDVPMPGIDPKDVALEVAGSTLTIRAETPGEDKDRNSTRYEQAFSVPAFLDLEKLTASHRHGMLRLSVPLKDSVKPRRVQIETQVEDQKQLAGAGAR